MVTRLGALAAIGALALALGRVLALVEPTPGQAPLAPILLVSAALGGGVALAARLTRLRWPLHTLVLAFATALVVGRLAAPETLMGGLLPTSSTPAAIASELTIALELIRFGAAPVVASAGLVAVLAVVFVGLGSSIVTGLAGSRPLLATTPSLAFYLLCATLDRRPPALWAPALLIVVGALAFLVEARKIRGGRARLRSSGRSISTSNWGLGLLLTAIVATAGSLAVTRWAATVPESGVVAWRNPTGFGGGLFAGFSYNLFTSMQQDLAEESPEIVFLARVSDSAPPNRELYWKLITLDDFDGTYWLPAPLAIKRPVSVRDWEALDMTFVGNTVAVEAVVRIEALRQNYLPVLYSPRGLTTDDRLLAQSHRAREDGSLKFDARTQQGLLYRVRSAIPDPDLSVLASTDGELSPMFERAQEEGLFELLTPAQAQPTGPSARVESLYTALPDEFSDVIRALARQVTERATTDFERGLLLEEFFRSTGNFSYDASASTGHSQLDLEEWLLDPESRNYRSGYCEQFATAMGLMARAIGVPARLVIGFSPGTVQTQADGSEIIVVRARNAHAWVELYMSGQGWIRFDPTPRSDSSNPATVASLGFSPVDFLPAPEDPAQAAAALPGSIAGIDRRFLEEGADPTLGTPLGGAAGAGAPIELIIAMTGALAFVPAAKGVKRWWRLRRLSGGDLVAAWEELVDRLGDLGVRVSPSSTPAEVAAAVDGALTPLATRVNAAVYGRRPIADGRAALRAAESSLQRRYSPSRRWFGWFRPQTLFAGWSRRRWRPKARR